MNNQKQLYVALLKADWEKEKIAKAISDLNNAYVTKETKKELKQELKVAKANLKDLYKEIYNLVPLTLFDFVEVEAKGEEETDEDYEARLKKALKQQKSQVRMSIYGTNKFVAFNKYYFNLLINKKKLVEDIIEYYANVEPNRQERIAENEELYSNVKLNKVSSTENEAVNTNVNNGQTSVAVVTTKASYEAKLATAYRYYQSGQFSATINCLEEVIEEYAGNGRVVMLYKLAKLGCLKVADIEKTYDAIYQYKTFVRVLKMLPEGAYTEYAPVIMMVLKKAMAANNVKDVAKTSEILSRPGILDKESPLELKFKDAMLKYSLAVYNEKLINFTLEKLTEKDHELLITRLSYQLRIFLMNCNFKNAKKLYALAMELNAYNREMQLEEKLIKARSKSFFEYKAKKAEINAMVEEYKADGYQYLLRAIADIKASSMKEKKFVAEVARLEEENVIANNNQKAMFISRLGYEYLNQKKWKKAEEKYAEALALDANCYFAHIGLMLKDYKLSSLESMVSKKVDYQNNTHYLDARRSGEQAKLEKDYEYTWIEIQIEETANLIKNLDKDYWFEYLGKWVGVLLAVISIFMPNYYVFAGLFGLAWGVPQLFKPNIVKGIIKCVIIMVIVAAIVIAPYIIVTSLLENLPS